MSAGANRIITARSIELIRAFVYYKAGYLPNPGGWMDQPVKLVDTFEIIDSEVRKIQQEKEKSLHAH
jgi:hypothetical protein